MRKLIIGLVILVVLVVLVVGALFALPLFIPSETVKAELIARLEEATGRDVRIDGPISISVLPTASLSASGVGLSGLTGENEAFAVDSVSFGLSLLPLISGNVEINALTITRPRILYEVDENGRSNWSEAAPEGPKPQDIEGLIAGGEAEAPSSPAAEPDATAEVVTGLDKLSINRLTIIDGTLTYRDRTSGIEETVEALNLTMDMPKITGPGTVEGSFKWQGVEDKIALTIGERPAADSLERMPVGLTLSTDGGSATLDGVALDGDQLFAGTFKAEGESLRGFLRAFADLPDAPGYGAFSLAGSLAAEETGFLMDKVSGTIGGVAVNGGLRAAFDRDRPGIGMKLAVGKIDTAAFTPPATTASGGGGGGGGGAIDFSPLGLLDANIAFSAEELTVGAMAVKNLGLDVKLAGGVLNTVIRSVEIAGAPCSGNVTVDARTATPAISGAAKMQGLDVGGLMALAGTTAPVTGTAGLDVTFKTSGATSEALVANLEASGKASLMNGKVVGLGLADMVGGDKAADTIDDIDVTATFASLTAPVALDGAATWRGQRFDLAAKADANALLAGKQVDVALTASSEKVKFGFTGKAGLSGLGTGKISLSTGSLRDLLAWIGQPLSAGRGLKAFSIDGNVALAADSFSFDKASFTLDKSSGAGSGKFTFGARPTIAAGLAMKVLDVTPYLASAGSHGGGGTGGSGGTGDGGTGGGGGGGGSGDAVDFTGLQAIDANLNLKADSILAGDIKIGPSALTAKIAGGKLDANLTEMALYSGKGNGTISVDGSSPATAIAASFRISGVEAMPFLTDLIGFKRIEGAGTFAFDIKANGKSEAALTQSLSGKGSMDVKNGAIVGVDIPKMLQSLSVQTLLGWQPGKDRTEFDKVGATFTITKGIVSNDDLIMAGPQFQLAGAGQIDLPAQTVSYRLNAKVAQGKNGKLQDFAVPVRVEGPLSKPKIYPEIQGVLENPQAAFDQLKTLGGGLLGLEDNKDQPGAKPQGKGKQQQPDADKKGKKKNGNATPDVNGIINDLVGQ